MVQPLVIPESPASPDEDAVPTTPLTPPQSSSQDRILNLTLQANAPGLRKRRLALGLPSDVQVSPPPKFRLLNAKLNIASLLNWFVGLNYRLWSLVALGDLFLS